MQSNVTFPSKRLMLSLFVCSVLPILLMGRSFLQSDNIFSSLASIGFGIFFTLLCFVPFYSIKHRTRLDFSAFAKNTSQTGFFFVSSYYCMYFTVITVSFTAVTTASLPWHLLLNCSASSGLKIFGFTAGIPSQSSSTLKYFSFWKLLICPARSTNMASVGV